MEKAGLKPLGGFQIVNLKGARICIAGIASGMGCKDTVSKCPKNLPLILLYHSPASDVVLERATAGIDLIACGHTHGGQIAVPFYGALITQAQTKREYASGLNRINNTWIYTNRGIGMEGHFPRMRFCAKPELTIFELTGPPAH